MTHVDPTANELADALVASLQDCIRRGLEAGLSRDEILRMVRAVVLAASHLGERSPVLRGVEAYLERPSR